MVTVVRGRIAASVRRPGGAAALGSKTCNGLMKTWQRETGNVASSMMSRRFLFRGMSSLAKARKALDPKPYCQGMYAPLAPRHAPLPSPVSARGSLGELASGLGKWLGLAAHPVAVGGQYTAGIRWLYYSWLKSVAPSLDE